MSKNNVKNLQQRAFFPLAKVKKEGSFELEVLEVGQLSGLYNYSFNPQSPGTR